MSMASLASLICLIALTGFIVTAPSEALAYCPGVRTTGPTNDKDCDGHPDPPERPVYNSGGSNNAGGTLYSSDGTSLYASNTSNGHSRAPIAESACDPEYRKSLDAEGWQNGQIETTQRQNAIYKPDSVLELTCFDQFANVMAKESKNMLTGTNRWSSSMGGMMGGGGGGLGGLLGGGGGGGGLGGMFGGGGGGGGIGGSFGGSFGGGSGSFGGGIGIGSGGISGNIGASFGGMSINMDLGGLLSGLAGGMQDKLEQELDRVVGDTYANYLENFRTAANDAFGGGRFKGIERSIADLGSQIIKGGGYNCNKMNQVFQMAKCQDFIADPETDGFYTQEEYARGQDKRAYPTRCAADARWLDMHTTATKAPPWKNDPPKVYNLKAEDCGKPEYPPIATGLTVWEGRNSYPEKSCSHIPKCYYDPKANKCVKG